VDDVAGLYLMMQVFSSTKESRRLGIKYTVTTLFQPVNYRWLWPYQLQWPGFLPCPWTVPLLRLVSPLVKQRTPERNPGKIVPSNCQQYPSNFYLSVPLHHQWHPIFSR